MALAVPNFDNVCRLCLSMEGEMILIYDEYPSNSSSALGKSTIDKILRSTTVKVSYTDKLPNRICASCNTFMDSYLAFKRRIVDNQVFLRHVRKKHDAGSMTCSDACKQPRVIRGRNVAQSSLEDATLSSASREIASPGNAASQAAPPPLGTEAESCREISTVGPISEERRIVIQSVFSLQENLSESFSNRNEFAADAMETNADQPLDPPGDPLELNSDTKSNILRSVDTIASQPRLTVISANADYSVTELRGAATAIYDEGTSVKREANCAEIEAPDDNVSKAEKSKAKKSKERNLFPCAVCNEGFPTARRLRNHLKKRHGELPCERCGIVLGSDEHRYCRPNKRKSKKGSVETALRTNEYVDSNIINLPEQQEMAYAVEELYLSNDRDGRNSEGGNDDDACFSHEDDPLTEEIDEVVPIEVVEPIYADDPLEAIKPLDDVYPTKGYEHMDVVDPLKSAKLTEAAEPMPGANQYLLIVMNQENEELKHVCNICGERFDSSITLREHDLLIGHERVTCEYCDSTYRSKKSLSWHIANVHTCLQCNVCGLKRGKTRDCTMQIQACIPCIGMSGNSRTNPDPDAGEKKTSASGGEVENVTSTGVPKDVEATRDGAGEKKTSESVGEVENVPKETVEASQSSRGPDAFVARTAKVRCNICGKRRRNTQTCTIKIQACVPCVTRSEVIVSRRDPKPAKKEKVVKQKPKFLGIVDVPRNKPPKIPQHPDIVKMAKLLDTGGSAEVIKKIYSSLSNEKEELKLKLRSGNVIARDTPKPPVKPIACSVCNEVFDTRADLSSHERDTLHNRFSCNACSASYSQQLTLDAHMNSAHRTFLCSFCGLDLKTELKLKTHLTIHDHFQCESKAFVCKLCGVSLNLIRTLRPHLATHGVSVGRGGLFDCDACGARYFTKAGVRSHIESKHAGAGVACDRCGAVLSSTSSLVNHVRSMHTHRKSREKVHKCPVCPKMFRKEIYVARHVRSHTGEKPFKCDTCERQFSLKPNYIAHLRQHTDQRPYACDVCGKAFRHNVSRKNHMKHHRDDGNKSGGEWVESD